MINQADVQAKDDSELLAIWEKQADYRPDVVEWVRAEIEKRHLDASHLHIRTSEEASRERELAGIFLNLRLLVIAQGAVGLLLVVVSFFVLKESEWLIGSLVLAGGALLITYAVGVWMRRRWAFASGFYVYLLITAWNAVVTLIGVIGIFMGGGVGAVLTLLCGLGMTGLSAGIAGWFNKLRKSQLVAAKPELRPAA